MALTSNEPTYVNYYSSLFEGLWNNGINAQTRIRDIEEGIDSANIEMIQNSHEALERAWSLVRTAKEEALIMYSTPRGFRRQLQMGQLQLTMDECKHWGGNKFNNTCVGCGVIICPVCLKESNSCKCEDKDICCAN